MAAIWRTGVLCSMAIAIALVPGPNRAHASSCKLQLAAEHVRDIAGAGDTELYLSGYIHHGRATYARERIEQFNERDPWGAGLGKTLRNSRGNDESIYVFALRDSHFQPQLMAGYAYQWVFPLGAGGLEASVGLSPQLMSRRDYFDALPFPILLPLATLGTREASLMVSYVPRLSLNKGSGDVLFFFLRFALR